MRTPNWHCTRCEAEDTPCHARRLSFSSVGEGTVGTFLAFHHHHRRLDGSCRAQGAVCARAQTYSTDRKTHLSWLLKGKRQKRGRRRAAAGAAMGVGTTLNGFVIYSCHPVYQCNNTHVVSRPVFWLGDAELLCARATIYSSPGVRTLGVVFMCVSVSERVCEFGARMSSRCKKSGSWPG